MPRPLKNSCDYFTHDKDMRNHRKVKSIRNKFGIQGYAVWCMLIEYLTGIDGNEFAYDNLELELIGGDFGVSVAEIRDVVDYCIKLEMLFNKDGFIYSESLNERLAPVYLKRGKAKEISEKQRRIKGKFTNSTLDTAVSVTETPQSKVNKSKVNSTTKAHAKVVVDDEKKRDKKQNAGIETLDQQAVVSALVQNEKALMYLSRGHNIKSETDAKRVIEAFAFHLYLDDKLPAKASGICQHFIFWCPKRKLAEPDLFQPTVVQAKDSVHAPIKPYKPPKRFFSEKNYSDYNRVEAGWLFIDLPPYRGAYEQAEVFALEMNKKYGFSNE